MAGYVGGTPYKGVAPALNTLLNQLNAMAPNRSKLSDGALGNQAHAVTVSFHNPNPAGIVQARDYTDDPANGLDCKWLAKALAQSGDPRILEIISNRMYWTPKGGWVPYYGTNPHDKHLHLSVRSEPALYNSTTPWDLSRAGGTSPNPETTEDYLMAGSQEYTNLLNTANAAAQISSEVRNLILDPNVGIFKQLGDLARAIAADRDDVDEKALAASVTASLVPAVVAALAGQGGLTAEQVQAATLAAVRQVFADAGS